MTRGVYAAVDAPGECQRRPPADPLRQSRFHRGIHTSRRINAGDDLADFLLHPLGQRLDIVGTAQRIDHIGQMRRFNKH